MAGATGEATTTGVGAVAPFPLVGVAAAVVAVRPARCAPRSLRRDRRLPSLRSLTAGTPCAGDRRHR